MPSEERTVLKGSKSEQSKAGPIVYLIHGTFADGAEWTQGGSLFATEIGETLSGALVRMVRWGGENSHDARILGGQRLAEEVRKEIEDFGDRDIFFIGHSHGGNVILYAGADPIVRRVTRGIVFLGTPFINVELRDPAVYAWVFATVISWASVPVLTLCSIFLFAWIGTSARGYEGEILAVLAVPLTAVYAWFVRPRFKDFLRARICLAGELALPEARRLRPCRPSAPTFVASVSLDEAGILLHLAERIASAPLRTTRLAAESAIAMTVTIMMLGAARGAVTAAWGIAEESSDFPMYVFAILVALGSTGVILPLPALLWATAMRRKAFGPERISMHAAARVRATGRPWWSESGGLRRRVPLSIRYWFHRKLRHSFFYDDPNLVHEVVEWISAVQASDRLDQPESEKALKGFRLPVWAWASALTLVAYLAFLLAGIGSSYLFQ